MSDLMDGLFQLHIIPPFVSKERPFVKLLFACIKDTSKVGRDRNIPLEDFYRSVMTYWELRDGVYLLRFANVNDRGKPYGNLSTIETLFEVVNITLRTNCYEILKPDDERYDYFCNPKVFENAEYDFLFAPDNKYVRTLVVIKR